MYQLTSILELSCIFSLVSLAAILTFRFAGFPDLSVDGVFGFGAIIFAKCLLSGLGVPLSFLVALCAGALVGGLTALLADRLHINPLLASVLVLTILYTLNLRILGKANQPLYGLLTSVWSSPTVRLGVFAAFAVIVLASSYVFFRTELGAGLRCTGSSPEFLTSVGRSVSAFKIALVALSGACVAAAGALIALKFHFADVSTGTGTIVIGIAALIIGERTCSRENLLSQILAAPSGILLYQLMVGVALSLGTSPTDVKLGTGVIAIALLALSRDERDRILT